jgi:hypothetical protein
VDPYSSEVTVLITFLVTSGLLLGILVATVMHLPLALKRLIYYTPAWLQSAVIHFAYGSWVGGVLGHVIGGLISVPWFFVVVLILRPRIRLEMAHAWTQNPIRRTVTRLRRRTTVDSTQFAT